MDLDGVRICGPWFSTVRMAFVPVVRAGGRGAGAGTRAGHAGGVGSGVVGGGGGAAAAACAILGR